MSRKQIGKKQRFEIFKRDGFECQYCGATPPGCTLHVDHIIPVALGGANDEDNLITSCDSCNLGKGARSLNVAPLTVEQKAAIILEREEQLRGYNAVLDAKRDRIESDTWRAIEYWQGDVDSVRHEVFASIKKFIERLGIHEVLDAIDIMRGARIWGTRRQLSYIAGVCWNKIRRAEQ